jgi:hypothetical protein
MQVYLVTARQRNISGGLLSTYKIRWIYNSGSGPTTTDVTTGTSYNATRTIPLSGSFTYVRAEVRDQTGALLANTEPIFFRRIANLPADRTVHVDAVTPVSGCSCSVLQTQGITSSTYSTNTLSLNLTNPAGSTVNLWGTSDIAPAQITMDGVNVSASSTLTDYEAQTGDAWYYNAASKQLYLQDKQAGPTSAVLVSFG